MTEILLTCPHCHQANFTKRGLAAHWCQALGTRRLSLADRKAAEAKAESDAWQTPSTYTTAKPSPRTMPKHNHALTLVADPAFAVEKSEVENLQKTALQMVAAVGQMEGRAATAAILAGITLHRVKASLKHGEFRPWLESNVHHGGHLKKTSANYYMRLAATFLESAKITKPLLLTLPGDQTALDLGDEHPARDLFAKITRFVGECSLSELLIKHGIKGVGLKTELEKQQAAEEAEDARTPEQQAAAARARAWEETYGAVQRLRAAFTEPDQVQHLTDPQQIERLHAEALEVAQLAAARLQALRQIAA